MNTKYVSAGHFLHWYRVTAQLLWRPSLAHVVATVANGEPILRHPVQTDPVHGDEAALLQLCRNFVTLFPR